jgi:2-oxoglutarate ferredoxin oxidoreductase subunit alpha
MTDGEVGHMREGITLPDFGEYEIINREKPPENKKDYIPFFPKEGKIPCIADFGQGYHTYITGLTHKQNGLPSTDDAEIHTQLVTRICQKISDDADKLVKVEKMYMEDAETIIICYGITSRAALHAVKSLRSQGCKVGYLRLISIWPFPENIVHDAGQSVKKILVPEMNLGQIVHKVREAVGYGTEVISLPKIGGVMHTPQDMVEMLKE